jgi:phosphate:Na+ symporter
MTEDPRVAHLLTDEKIAFRDAETQAALAHLNAIGSGSAALARASAFRLELMRDLKQINGHIVAASAYPLLERTGELLPSRRVARKR